MIPTRAIERPIREEWDFRNSSEVKDFKHDTKFEPLDAEEVWLCLNYEEARHGADVQPTLEGRLKLQKQGINTESFDDLLKNYWECDPNGKEGIPPIGNWFYLLWPEWPQTPCLTIPRTVRRKRRSIMWAKVPPRTLPLVKLSEIRQHLLNFRAGCEIEGIGLGSRLRQLELNDDVWTLPKRRSPKDKRGLLAPPIEIAAFKVDLELSDKSLTRLFSNWLIARRKAKGYKAIEGRGSSSETTRMRAQLCAIGAARLVAAGMTYQEAHDYTELVSGIPLFADKAAWSRAVRKGERVIGSIE